MIRHEYKANSDWTICHNVNSRYVVTLTFREYLYIEGIGARLGATDCLAFESDNYADCLNAAIERAKTDKRESSMCGYETWIIKEPARLAGKRDNRRIG